MTFELSTDCLMRKKVEDTLLLFKEFGGTSGILTIQLDIFL